MKEKIKEVCDEIKDEILVSYRAQRDREWFESLDHFPELPEDAYDAEREARLLWKEDISKTLK